MSDRRGILPSQDWKSLGRDPVPLHDDGTDAVAIRTPPRRPYLGFEREHLAFQASHPLLLSRAEGMYVVVVGDKIAGPVGSFPEAMELGYASFGLEPLYIKRILAEEPASETTRDIDPYRLS